MQIDQAGADLSLSLGWLEALLAAVKFRSFRKAAATLGRHESTVGRQIRELEKWLGRPLVNAASEITPIDFRARKFLALAEQVLANFDSYRNVPVGDEAHSDAQKSRLTLNDLLTFTEISRSKRFMDAGRSRNLTRGEINWSLQTVQSALGGTSCFDGLQSVKTITSYGSQVASAFSQISDDLEIYRSSIFGGSPHGKVQKNPDLLFLLRVARRQIDICNDAIEGYNNSKKSNNHKIVNIEKAKKDAEFWRKISEKIIISIIRNSRMHDVLARMLERKKYIRMVRAIEI